MKALYLALISTLLFTACSFERKEEPKPAPEPPVVEKATNDLFESIDKQDVAAVEKFIKDGADLKRFDDEGKTPLMRSVQVGNARIIEILITSGSYVYQPEENNPNSTAFLMAKNTGGLVLNLFEKEKLRLLTDLESKMSKREYKVALEFVDTNYLPLDIVLPASSLGPLEYLIENDPSPNKDSMALADYYLEHRHSVIVTNFENVKEIIEYASRSQNKEFFGTVVKRYAHLDQSEVNYKYQYVGLYFPVIDINMEWLIEKTNVYVESGIVPEPTSFAASIFPTIEEYQSLNRDQIDQFISLMDSYFLGTKEIKGKSRQLPEEYLEDYIFAGFHEVENGFYLVSTLLSIFAKHKIYDHYLFDKDILSRAFKSDIQYTIPLTDLIEFIDLRAALSGGKISKNGDFDLEKSIEVDGSVHKKGPIEFLIEDYPRTEKRREIIVHLLSKMRELPEGIISLVLKQDRELFEAFLNSDLIDQSENRGAIISALENASSGSEARLYLVRLKEKGFSALTKRGPGKALETAFQRLWDGDESFSSAVEYLFTEYSEYKSISVARKLNLIKNHSSYVRKSKKNWNLFTDLLLLLENVNEQIDSMTWLEKSERDELKGLSYKTNLVLNNETIEYNITVPMDVLISLYEVYSSGQAQAAPLRNMVAYLADVTSRSSLGLSVEKMNGFLKITDQLLVIAHVFSTTPDEIIEKKDADPHWLWWLLDYTGYPKGSLRPVPWNAILVDPMYIYYSRHTAYWKIVVDEYTRN